MYSLLMHDAKTMTVQKHDSDLNIRIPPCLIKPKSGTNIASVPDCVLIVFKPKRGLCHNEKCERIMQFGLLFHKSVFTHLVTLIQH